jgi:hypothetical protein
MYIVSNCLVYGGARRCSRIIFYILTSGGNVREARPTTVSLENHVTEMQVALGRLLNCE